MSKKNVKNFFIIRRHIKIVKDRERIFLEVLLYKNISFFYILSRQYEKFFYQKIFPEIFGLIFVRNPYNFDIYNLTFSDYGLLFHILIRVRCAGFLYFGRTKNEVFEPTTRRKHET